MEKVRDINPQRIGWCCDQYGISVPQLAGEVDIAVDTLEHTMQGDAALSVTQLRKIAEYFNRGMLFFLERDPVNEEKVFSLQFRTITNQKPALSPKLSALVERMERQRDVYIGLREDLGEDTREKWYPTGLRLNPRDPIEAAGAVRQWLGLRETATFDELRRAVEAKHILVFVSNGYKGAWQIEKDDPIRGFSLYYPAFPIIAIKKQRTEGPQAFTLMHELGHLLLHRESFIDDEADFHDYKGKERIANEFAGNVLVPERFLHQIDLDELSRGDVDAYDDVLGTFCERWCVSTEVILRRLLNKQMLPRSRYQAYRNWRQSLPAPKGASGGSRYRYKEPVRVFGEPFVRTVFDALYGKHITLAKASTYLDNLKIQDLHRLERARVHV